MDEFEEILISTPIDKLIEIIKNEQEVTSSYLALKTKYDQATIEEWVRYLEREGIVEIKYQLNEMHISWNSPKKEEFDTRKEKFKKRADTVEKQIEQLKEDVNIEIRIVYELLDQINSKIDEMKLDREKLMTFTTQFTKFREELNKDLEIISRDIARISQNVDEKYRQVSSLATLISEVSVADVQELEQNIRKSLDEKLKMIDTRIQDLDIYVSKLQNISEEDINKIYSRLEELEQMKEIIRGSESIEGGLRDLIRKYEYILEVLAEREKLLKELDELEQRNIELQRSLNNLSGNIFEISEKLQKLAQEYYDIQGKSAELATQIKSNQDILRNIQVEDTSIIDQAKQMLETLRSFKDDVKSFEKLSKETHEILERIQDIGKVRMNLERYKREYLLEVAKYAEMVNEDLKTLETLLDIKKRMISELSTYKDTLLGYEEEFKKYVKLFIEQKESFESMRKTLNQMIQEGEFAEALNRINSTLGSLQQVEQKLEEARRLLVQLEEIKININVLTKELNLLKLRTPENEREIQQKIEHQEKSLKEQEIKRRSLEEWIRSFTKK
ncbi:MAG: hypothetical protein QXL02_00210 [Candidatus Anstonellales archaeon]